ncbi:hypothetical protein MMC18_000750 [Xylographa bjoerkii]|nr:hypothetical protein [Xylographa bjoerkii]
MRPLSVREDKCVYDRPNGNKRKTIQELSAPNYMTSEARLNTDIPTQGDVVIVDQMDDSQRPDLAAEAGEKPLDGGNPDGAGDFNKSLLVNTMEDPDEEFNGS